MAVEKRKYAQKTAYRAYWRNPWTGKIEKGPSRGTLKEAKKDDAEIKVKLEYEPEYFLPSGMPKPGSEPTLAQLSLTYLARQDIAASTRESEFFHFSTIPAYITAVAVSGLTPESLLRFEKEQRESGIKQNTIHRRIGLIRTILNRAVRERVIQTNPVRGTNADAALTKRYLRLRQPKPKPCWLWRRPT